MWMYLCVVWQFEFDWSAGQHDECEGAASAVWNPCARLIIVRILLLSHSWRPLLSSRSTAAAMPSLWARIVLGHI